MSSIGSQSLVAAMFGQDSGMIIGNKAVYAPKGYQATTPVHLDDVVEIQPVNGAGINFGDTLRFKLNKNSVLIGDCHVELQISAATLDALRSAAYVKNLGDQIKRRVTFRYGTQIIQSYPGLFDYIFTRVCKNDNHIEGRNAFVLGNLPPGGTTEPQRAAALVAALTLVIPLDELYWTHSRDEYWMTGAYSLEGELQIELEDLARLVYSDNGADPFIGVGVRPVVQSALLRYREVTLSAPEKRMRLQYYATEQGLVHHFLDVEEQANTVFVGTGTGQPRDIRVPLPNFRLSMAELLFVVRVASNSAGGVTPAVDADWRGDAVESSTVVSTITGASIATQVPITAFRFDSNGKTIFRSQTDLWNRAGVRARYHPDSQIADSIYIIPLCDFPEDRKNASGHLSASALGSKELVITLPDWAATINYRVDVYSHSHNLLQSRGGSIAKTFN